MKILVSNLRSVAALGFDQVTDNRVVELTPTHCTLEILSDFAIRSGRDSNRSKAAWYLRAHSIHVEESRPLKSWTNALVDRDQHQVSLHLQILVPGFPS